MIEMRWIVVPAGSGRGLLGGAAGQMHEMVLQYRWNKALEGINTGSWSEWRDVAPPSQSAAEE